MGESADTVLGDGGLGWTGLDWTELDWTALDWTVLLQTEHKIRPTVSAGTKGRVEQTLPCKKLDSDTRSSSGCGSRQQQWPAGKPVVTERV